MTKINTNKIVAVLLVLCMITSVFVSTTLAKYTTSGQGSDTARVAKWGIKFDNSAKSTFNASYDSGKVASADSTALVVAPGTTDSATYAMTGTPETAYKVTFNLDYTTDDAGKYNFVNKDVFLGKGAYEYGAGLGYEGMNVAEADFATGAWFKDNTYYPIEWTIKVESTASAGTITGTETSKTYRTLQEVDTALKKIEVAYDANEACDAKITLTWKWAFEGQNDNMDTVLGNMAAGITAHFTSAPTQATADATTGAITAAANTYNNTIAYKLVMTATQVD